jgi:hypothetical protein
VDLAAERVRAVRHRTGATVLADVACLQCSYNLKGLDAGGACPECGARIEASLATAPGLREIGERFAGPAQSLAAAHAATLGFALVLLQTACGAPCALAVGAIIVGGGCALRTMAVVHMEGVEGTRSPVTGPALRRAMGASALETGLGLAIILCLFFSVPARLPPAVGPYVLPLLCAAWAGVLALGMVASAGLADALVDRFRLNAARSMLPVQGALVAPILYLAYVVAAEVSPHLGNPAWFTVPTLLLGAAAMGAWLIAAWFARSYMMGVADLLNAVPTERPSPGESLRIPAPIAPRTDAEREARRQREDDSPIPME